MKCFNINCPPHITCLSFLFFLDTLDLDEARDAIEDILSSLSLLMATKFSPKSRNGEIFWCCLNSDSGSTDKMSDSQKGAGRQTAQLDLGISLSNKKQFIFILQLSKLLDVGVTYTLQISQILSPLENSKQSYIATNWCIINNWWYSPSPAKLPGTLWTLNRICQSSSVLKLTKHETEAKAKMQWNLGQVGALLT